jgi:hypothetical protein
MIEEERREEDPPLLVSPTHLPAKRLAMTPLI